MSIIVTHRIYLTSLFKFNIAPNLVSPYGRAVHHSLNNHFAIDGGDGPSWFIVVKA
jgi:hypothetical protein